MEPSVFIEKESNSIPGANLTCRFRPSDKPPSIEAEDLAPELSLHIDGQRVGDRETFGDIYLDIVDDIPDIPLLLFRNPECKLWLKGHPPAAKADGLRIQQVDAPALSPDVVARLVGDGNHRFAFIFLKKMAGHIIPDIPVPPWLKHARYFVQ
jgi:hypothetical protein